MEILIYIGIYTCFILVGLGVLAIFAFGARGLRNGKMNPISAAMVGSPLLVAVLLGLILGDWVKGAVIVCIVIFILASVAVVANGVRGFIRS